VRPGHRGRGGQVILSRAPRAPAFAQDEVTVRNPESYEEFVDHVTPVLRERGLMQRDYAEGTLRHKLFGRGDRLPERHPAARYRSAFAPQHA
jgi:long-chain alkane monooxygenase